MDIEWLEDFLALDALGVFSRAADARNVTQPAFTRRIKKLEYALGAALFDRSVHPIQTTEAGMAVKPMIATAVQMIALARAIASKNTP